MKRMTKAEKAKLAAELEAKWQKRVAIVRGGKCPQCGAGLRRNLALTGWWQCEQYRAVGFRKNSSKPSCSFELFI